MIELIAQAAANHLQAQADAKFQERVYGRASGGHSDQALQQWMDAHAAAIQQRDENYVQSVINAGNFDGVKAQVDALKAALAAVVPNHPLLQNSPQKYVDGKPKSKLRLMFEAAFDARLRNNNMNPLKFREN